MSTQQTFYRDIDKMNYYNNKRLLVDEMPSIVGIPHIFFTTPMMNLNSRNCMSDGFMAYMYKMRMPLLSSLSASKNRDGNCCYTTSPFIKLLYNSATSFSASDMISKTKEVGETYYGYKETLPASNVDSINGDELSINFLDWKDLPVLNLINAWFIYHNKVRRGEFDPMQAAINLSYLDYVSSIYYFVTEMDGETLQYWAKYTGVVPINVPFSAFSSQYTDHEVINYSINFVYSFKEDMNPDILLDFNDVSNGKSGLLNFGDWNGEEHHTMKTGYQKASKNPDYVSTEYEKNGYDHPEIVLTGRTNSSGVVTSKPRFKLKFTTLK